MRIVLPTDETGRALEALNEAIANKVPLERMSRLYAEYMLQVHGNNKLRTADALGIDRRTVQRWAKKTER